MSTVIDLEFTIPETDVPSGLGVPDQSAALMAWINTNVPNGRGPVRDDSGNVMHDDAGEVVRAKNRIIFNEMYRVDEEFRMVGRTDLVFDFEGGGGGFARGTDMPGVKHTAWNHCAYIDLVWPFVHGLKPVGAGYDAAREHEAAFWFESCVAVNINGAESTGVWGDHFYLGKHSGDPKWCDRIMITNSLCGESGRDPLAVTAAGHVTLSGGSFGRCRTCVDLEPNGASGGVSDVLVENVDFGAHSGNFFAAMGGNWTEGTVDRVAIVDNTVRGGTLTSVVSGGLRRSDFTVNGNTATQGTGNGKGAVIQMRGVTGQKVVTGNKCPLQPNRTPPMRMARFWSKDGTEIDPASDPSIICFGNTGDAV
jgi:hypothetical protein